MRILAPLGLAVLLAIASPAAATPPQDAKALGRTLVTRLHARKSSIAPQTHATDFGNDIIGCITLTKRELRQFGFRGHAFFCEAGICTEGETPQVVGAILGSSGGVRCYITGTYVGDLCYDLSICGIFESACVE